MHRNFAAADGQRWLITDLRIYDWWDLASVWGSSEGSKEAPHAAWVRELMAEHGVRALPRSPSAHRRVLDSRDFWVTFGLSPKRTLLEQ